MAMKAIIDQAGYDALGETVQSEYVAGTGDLDGQFTLDVTAVQGYSLDNVSGLKTALATERDSLAKANKSLKGFEGLNVTEARAAIVKVQTMDKWTPEEKVQEKIEAQLAQLSEKHNGEMKKVADELGMTTNQLQKALIDQAAMTALAKLDGSPVLLLPAIRAQTRLKKQDDGSYKVEVVDGNGTVRISPAANSTLPMTVEELTAELKTLPDYAPAFKGSGGQGSGAPGSEHGGAKVDGDTIVISREDAKDNAKYVAAKELATKEGKELRIAS